jgi:hypothetical protein
LVEKYGDALICVHYRYNAKTQKQYKTVEIIYSENEWSPPPDRYPDGALVPLKIRIKETALQEQGQVPWAGDGISSNRSGLYHMGVLPDQSWKSV